VARDVAQMLRETTSMEQVSAIIRSHALAFRFVHMEILHEDAPAAGTVRAPDHIGSATWLLEYPILDTLNGHGVARGLSSGPVLAIWCSVTPEGRPVNAERVAGILAPAIAFAMQSVLDAESEPVFEGRPRASRGGAHFHTKRHTPEQRRMSSDASPIM
jgi:hypothetical protein